MTTPDPAKKKGSVLIAEDVKVISRKMVIGLEQSGYDVALAEDGEQCLQMARELLPDLIILDIMMPKVHGIEVLKQLRADVATQHIGVVICTAKSFDTEFSHVATLGAFDFLIKPFSVTALTEMVNRFFGSQPGTGFMTERTLRTRRATTGEIFRPTLQHQNTSFTLWGTRGSTPRRTAALYPMARMRPHSASW